jgi:BirA family transcriptional regulator, biotin operon repressor / biotin---[acetyl-CoA-carboxylase] ligase
VPPELIRLGEVPSTMDAAHQRAERGAAHGTAIVARRQTAGRGTRGRNWVSDEGGLWLSVVARPHRTDALEALSLRVGLAVATALEVACPVLPRLALKWPNDIVLDGRKLAGILCEARWGGGACQWVVVGLGVNVRNAIPEALRGSAVALRSWAPEVEPDALAAPIAAAVAFAAREAGLLSEAELRAFALRDALAGAHTVAPLAGTAEGITAAGALRIRTESGPVREILAGVVTTAS